MALLKANFTKYEKVSLKLSTETLAKLNTYAKFLGNVHAADRPAEREEVIDQALNYIFRKDKDFQKFLAAQDGDSSRSTKRKASSATEGGA